MGKFWVILGLINLLFIIAALIEDNIRLNKTIDQLSVDLIDHQKGKNK